MYERRCRSTMSPNRSENRIIAQVFKFKTQIQKREFIRLMIFFMAKTNHIKDYH